MEKCGRGRQVIDDSTTWRMRIACLITKATDTQLEYVIIIAFPRQQWLRVTIVMFLKCIAFLVTKYWELHGSNRGPRWRSC